MKLIAWKRFSLLVLLVLVMVSFGCSKKVAAPPPPPAPAPPPPPPPPAPTVTLNADRTTITAGQSLTLTYSSQNATAMTITGIGPVTPPANGTRQVSPTANTTYTATATGPGGTANSAAVSVTVNQPPPPPPPPKVEPQPPAPKGPSIDELFTRTMVPILFDYDKYNIRTSEEPKLLSIAAWLKQNPTLRFATQGHADERGSQEYNIALGDERAAAVKKYLVGQGIADSRITTVSFGEERPTCRVSNEDCWQQNRRSAFERIP